VSGRLNEMFKSDDQQDAQEYLEFLLDGLHEDLNPYANRTKLRPLTDEEERRRETLPQQTASHLEWQRYIHSNFSVVVNWFQGQLSSRLMCLTCGITSTTYSGFMYLSLPIPSKRGGFTLADCLEEFVKEEILEKDDAWHCPNCKKARKATKKLTITRLPHILIIHLKRFTNRGLWRDKLNTMVQFPLKDLNLTKYVPPLLPRGALGPNAPEPSAEVTPPFMYDLYGVCNHYGTLNGGHYTSFVRNNHQNAWNHFDDSKASFVDDSAVVVSNLFKSLHNFSDNHIVSECIRAFLGPVKCYVIILEALVLLSVNNWTSVYLALGFGGNSILCLISFFLFILITSAACLSERRSFVDMFMSALLLYLSTGQYQNT
jgi:ubiquitin carboxyl-terminal hydrolase 8